jgi:hypothetical protein
MLERIATDCIAVRVRLLNRVVKAIYDEALWHHGLRVSQASVRVGDRREERCLVVVDTTGGGGAVTKLDEHPSVIRHRDRPKAAVPASLDAEWLRRICLEAGADDVGFVAIDRPEIDDQRAEILNAFLATRTLVSFVCRLNPEPIRSPARSIANQEFHANYEQVNLPLRVHGARASPGDRRDPGPHDHPQERACRRGTGGGHRGQRHVARLPVQGAEPDLGDAST